MAVCRHLCVIVVYPVCISDACGRVYTYTVDSSEHMEWTPYTDASEVIQSFQKLSLTSEEMQNISDELDDAVLALRRLDLNVEEMEICK